MCHESMLLLTVASITGSDLATLLDRIGVDVPEATAAGWSQRDRSDVCRWAAALYVADGRPLYIPPVPDVVRPYLAAAKGD